MACVQIQFTIDDSSRADTVVDDLLARRLVACGQRMGPVLSRYWWEGTLERAEEWMVVLKTRSELVDQVFAAVLATHPYSPGYRNSFTGTYRPGRPTAPPAGPVDSPVPPPEAPTSSHPASDRPTSSGLAPGWFTDPFVRHEQRYWSGNGWTEHVTDDGAPGIDPPDTARGPDRPAD